MSLIREMRTTTICVLGLLALACGGSGSASNEDTSGTTGTTVGSVDGSSSGGSTGPACTPGTEGCVCDAGACAGELACYSQVCVMPPVYESSGGVETTTSSGESSSESSSTGEPSSGSTTDAESSSTAALPEPCEFEGNHVCVDGVLDTCDDDVVVSQSCADICALTGYFSTGCADINGCECSGFADPTCMEITGKFCTCYGLFGTPCEEAFEASVYNWCFDPTINESSHDIVVCFGDFPTDNLDQCNAAADVCYNL